MHYIELDFFFLSKLITTKLKKLWLMAAQHRAWLALLFDFFLSCSKITEQAIIKLVESYPQISRVITLKKSFLSRHAEIAI